MQPRRRGGGPELPYRLIAGVEPCPGGWLLVGARLRGVTVVPMQPEVRATLAELLDYRPAFDILAMHCHLSFPDRPTPGGRSCDRLARQLLGWPRAGAITSPPHRALLEGRRRRAAPAGLSPVSVARLDRYREAAGQIEPYHQRQAFEVHPELSFHQLNGDRPLQHPKSSPEGRAERRALVCGRIPGLETVLDARLRGVTYSHLLDACAALTTARRIAARAVVRIPEIPEWDGKGIRMELVR